MGLISLTRNIVAVANAFLNEPVPPAGVLDEEGPWDGPDDLWPEEEDVDEVADPPHIAETPSEPALVVTQEWGLRLPGGDIMWNNWQGTPFYYPLDRLQMVSKLQQTAAQVGYAPGDQTEAFLAQYSWATRNQIARVVYEDTGSYTLLASEVSELGTPQVEGNEEGEARDDE